MCRDAVHCFIPPYVLEQLARSPDPKVRERAMRSLAPSAEARTMRAMYAAMPAMGVTAAPKRGKNRLVHDMEHRTARWLLPGKLMRAEGQGPTGDAAVDEAYDHSGTVYDFYWEIFNRDSIDDRGMNLVSSVHYGDEVNNAFWNGEQMLYGDGDQEIFKRFTQSLDVVGHELSHGVISFTSNLDYYDEPGALNEHFADVMGVLVEQWKRGDTADKANWLIGDEIMVGVKALRTMKAEKAYENDPILGTDPQPKHMKDKYEGPQDNGGVHYNSGIPNHAFYLVATSLGGKAWEKAGRIWYEAFTKRLYSTSKFQDAADMTSLVAGQIYGFGSKEHNAVEEAWKAVGVTASTPKFLAPV